MIYGVFCNFHLIFTFKGFVPHKLDCLQYIVFQNSPEYCFLELYLNSLNEQYGPGHQSGQIRVAFATGNTNTNKKLFGGIILGDSKAARSYGIRKSTKEIDWSKQFHRFAVTWSPGNFICTILKAMLIIHLNTINSCCF